MYSSKELTEIFHKYLTQASKLFMQQLNDVTAYKKEITYREDNSLIEKNRSYGARTFFSGDTIKVHFYPFKDNYLIHGVLAREAFNILLPETIKDLDLAKDLGWEFARIKLPARGRKKWIKLWKSCSGAVKVASMLYNAPFDFPLFTEVTKGDFLVEILKNFSMLGYRTTRFTDTDYVKEFIEFYQEYVYKFDADELRIINYLTEHPTATSREMAKVFGAPYSKIYRKHSALKRRHIITQWERVSYSKLGMITTLIWVGNIKPDNSQYQKLLKHPALFSVFNYVDCGGGAVFSFAFPKNKDNISEFKRMVTGLQKKIRCTDCFVKSFRPEKAYISQSFSMLVPGQGKWVFNPKSWKTWVTHLLETDITKLTVGININVTDLRNVPLYKFSSLDIAVIKEVYNGSGSVRKIAKKLKKSPNNVVEAHNKLKQLGVIRDTVRVHYLGLSSIIFLYMKISNRLILPVVMALKEFPYVISYQTSSSNFSEIISFIRISPQIENKVIKALHDVFSPRVPLFKLYIGRYVYWGSYRIPFDLWDNENHCWKPFSQTQMI